MSRFDICLCLVSTSFCVCTLIITTGPCLMFHVFTHRVLFPVLFCCLGFCVSCLVWLPVCDCLHQSTCVQLSLPSLCVHISVGDPLCPCRIVCLFVLMSWPALLSNSHDVLSCSPIRDVLSRFRVSFPRVFSVQDHISLKEIYFC